MELASRLEGTLPFYRANVDLWKGVARICDRTNAGRLIGLPVGIATNVLFIARTFTTFGESAFKGTANIAAAPFNKKAFVLTGIKQLASLIPQALKIVLLIPHLIIKNLYIQSGLLIFGGSFAKKQVQNYEESIAKALVKATTKPHNHLQAQSSPIANLPELHEPYKVP